MDRHFRPGQTMLRLTALVLCLQASSVLSYYNSDRSYITGRYNDRNNYMRQQLFDNDYDHPQASEPSYSHRDSHEPHHNPVYNDMPLKYPHKRVLVKVRTSKRHYPKPVSYPKPINAYIDSEPVPVNVFFRSASPMLNVKQVHHSASGSFQETYSYDAPHIIKHHVTKPIHQEVMEVIVPRRKIIQTIEPVQEQIITMVAKQSEHHMPEPHSEPSPEPYLGESVPENDDRLMDNRNRQTNKQK